MIEGLNNSDLFHYKVCKYCGKDVKRLISVSKTSVCTECDNVLRKANVIKHRKNKERLLK